MTVRRIAAAVAVGALGMVVGWSVRRWYAAERIVTPRWLVVANGATGDLSLVDVAASSHTRVRVLRCAALGRWPIRVGVKDGYVVALDTERPAVVLLELATLRRIARGDAPCAPDTDVAARRVSIASGHVPYRGLLAGDRLYVSDFADNTVEVYDWIAGAVPDLRLVRTIAFTSDENLGIAEMAMRGDVLLVAATGYFCFARDCPTGRLHASHLYFVPPDAAPPFVDAHPANLNAGGLYHRPGTGATYVVAAGDFTGGRSSLQRLEVGAELGAEIALPRNAAARSAFALDDAHFVVTQFSGEHVFVIDAADDHLASILRFDGGGFEELPLETPVLPDRAQADIQDILPDDPSAGTFLLVDAKGERLIHAAFDPSRATLRATGTTSLATAAFRAVPMWGVWLDEARADRAGGRE